MAPTVRILDKTATIFLGAMQPKSIQINIIFILFYIFIEVSYPLKQAN